MGEKVAIVDEKIIKLEGYFDLKETYNNLMNYIENSLTFDTTINEYEEKNADGSKKISASVDATRQYNEIYKIMLKLKFDFSGKDVEVDLNNKTLKLVQGDAKIIINAYLDPDWGAVREKSPLAKFLNQVYVKYIGNDEESIVKKAAKGDIEKLIIRFKQHFNATIR